MIRKMTYGEEHLDVAASYVSLGIDYFELRQLTEGNECTEMALMIRNKISDQEDSFYSLRYGYLSFLQQNDASKCNGRNLFFENKTYCDERKKKRNVIKKEKVVTAWL